MSTTARKPNLDSKAPTQSADWDSSQAEIRIAYTPAGRETIDAITAEMLGEDAGASDLPELEVNDVSDHALATEHAAQAAGFRAPQMTLPYADRVPNAPGAKTPSKLPRAKLASEPEISLREAAAEPETMAAIERELRGVAADGAPPAALEAPREALEIFEMATFVVRGQEATSLSTDALRRRFVEQHLMRRLPVSSSEAIDRVDVTPWTVRNTFVIRVWCRLSE